MSCVIYWFLCFRKQMYHLQNNYQEILMLSPYFFCWLTKFCCLEYAWRYIHCISLKNIKLNNIKLVSNVSNVNIYQKSSMLIIILIILDKNQPDVQMLSYYQFIYIVTYWIIKMLPMSWLQIRIYRQLCSLPIGCLRNQ